MAQLVLPSQLRGRRNGAATMTVAARRRRGQLPRFRAAGDDVAALTRACVRGIGELEEDLGDAVYNTRVICEAAGISSSRAYAAQDEAYAAYQTCVRSPGLKKAELYEGNVVRMGSYAPGTPITPSAPTTPDFLRQLVSSVTTRAQAAVAPRPGGMSTGTKLAIGAGVLGGLFLLAKAVR